MPKRIASLSLLAGLAVVFVASGPLMAIPSNNLELVAVPTPGKVVIDGKLDDWDLNGTIYSCPDTQSFTKMAAVYSAAMYDADGLYISCRWIDPTPMANMVDPDEPGRADRGWCSDCLQVRILTDTPVHITAWYYKGGDKNALHVHMGDIRQAPKPEFVQGLKVGAKMAFQKNPDGSGYTQEIFLPWKLVSSTGKAYQAGESFKFGLHFNWGGGDNKSWRAMEWQDVVSSPTANRTFFWQDPSAWGKIRFSPTGHIKLPKHPWEDTREEAVDLSTYGSVPLKYELPEAAAVTLVIEDASGKRVHNLISGYPRLKGANADYWDCLDDRGDPVKPGTYRWRGLINPGLDVRYKLHVFPHTNPPWKNAAGTGGWGADHSAPSYVAAGGQRVYLLYHGAESGSALVCCDLQGNKIWGHGGAFQGGGEVCAVDDKFVYFANNEKLTRVEIENGKAMPFDGGQQFIPTGGLVPPTGLAVRDGKLYVACASKDLVRVFDLASGNQVKDLVLAKPMGLDFDKAGRLLAVSGNTVVAVNVQTGQAQPVVTAGLSEPHGLAVGPDGLIHVVNAGTNQVFSFRPDGKNVRTTGTPGGRPAVGKWDRDGMFHPTGVGLDADGNLWVSEADGVAKRLSKWGKDGKNLGEWLGPSPYGGDGIVDHKDRTRVYCGGLEFKVDWDTGKAEPAWTHLRGLEVGQPGMAGTIAYGGFWEREGFTMTYKGHDYFCWDRGLICIKRGLAWVPAASIGYVRQASPGEYTIWSDRNGDGKVREDEIFTPGQGFETGGAGGWGILWSRKDMSTVRGISGGKYLRLTPAEFVADGVPVFDQRSFSHFEVPVGRPVDADDNMLIAFYEDSHGPWMKDLREHPLGDLSGIKGYDRSGKLIWTYPQAFSGIHGSFKAPLPSRPGEVIGTFYIMGVADMGQPLGKVVCFNGYYGQRFLFTTDGLFVGALFKDSRTMPATPEKVTKDMLMNDMSAGNEPYAGTFSRNDNGEVYLTGNFGGPMAVVMRVEGLDKVTRLPGESIQLTDALIAQGQAERQKHQAAAKAGGAKVLTIVRGQRKINADLSDWDLDAKGVDIRADSRRSGRAALAYDDDNLYAAFRVKDNSPWKNSGNDAKVIFLYGDSVDIQLGLDPQAPAGRNVAVAGDVRITIAPQQGKPLVMLYEPVVPGFQGQKVPFISPVGRYDVDRVEQLTDADVSVKVEDDGYVVEVAIPLKALGHKIPAGAQTIGDVGVLFSDDPGTECVLRKYWSNTDTNMTSDLPSEIRFQTHEWGKVIVE